jgi:alcohol dehydrogenase class IV
MKAVAPPARAFTYAPLTGRVVFACGARARLSEEAERAGISRALIFCTAGQRTLAEETAAGLGERVAGIFAGALMHVPIETAREARAYASETRADGCIAIGGGSTIGLAKAVALVSELPIVAVPTTYAGSEMTPIYGITENNRKTTGRDPRVLPRTVIYDPELTLGLSAATSAASGLNAVAHAVEALYAPDGNPIVSLLAEESIAALGSALPRIVREPLDLEARSDALYGAWLAGSVLGAVGMSLHHKLCHTLGGTYNLPHAQTHAVVLPYAAAYNAPFAVDAMVRVSRALGRERAEDAPSALFDLARAVRAPVSLAALGMRADRLDEAADLASRSPYPNPRPIERAAIRELLQRAFDGNPPRLQSL